MRPCLTTIALLVLAACGSSPKTHFYTLSVARTGDRSALSYPVQVTAIHLPPSLDRRQMVRMTSANSVEVSETNRWSGTLDDMIRNVLSQDLAKCVPKGRLILPEAPAPPGTRSLVVTLAQFGPDASREVRLTGSWALLGAGSDVPLMEHAVSINAGPAPDADAMAAAMSRALGELASAIAVKL
jgi:uncharacterized protein